MRPQMLIIAVTAALGATGAMAKDNPDTPAAAAPEISLPRLYSAYAQPAISDCRAISPLQRECTVPAMTAGRYLVEAAASATSTATGATQSLTIKLGQAPCVATRPAPFTGKEGLRVGCEVNFLTDNPLTVSAVYETHAGTPDPKGPQLVLRPIPWNGVVEARGILFRAKANPPAKP